MKALVIATFLACVPLWASAETYHVVPEESRLEIHVGRAGLFKMFGHDHLIRVASLAGVASWDEAHPEGASFELRVAADALVVADEDVSDDERAEVQATMETEALDVTEHAFITFDSTRVEVKREHRVVIVGELDLRGVRRQLDVPATIMVDGDRLVVRGAFALPSKEWGVPQISALGGSVKTKSELAVELEIVAVR